MQRGVSLGKDFSQGHRVTSWLLSSVTHAAAYLAVGSVP
jgi:hypothetical protein